MVPIPTEADENARRCIREREELVSERVSLVNRIGEVLVTLGVSDFNPLLRNRRQCLEELRTGLGTTLPPHARAKVIRMSAPGKLVRSSRWKSGPSKGQRPLGSERCVTPGDSGCEAYTTIGWGVGLSLER
jgi:hypothetical protein